MTEDQAFELLKMNISQLVTLSEHELQEALKFFTFKEIKKKEHWIVTGNLCTEVIFVAKGCLRYYCTKSAVERTTGFFFEGSWFTDFESWLGNKPCTFSMEALEDTVVTVVGLADLEKMYDMNPKYERIGRLIAESTIISMCNRYNSLLNDSPLERYIKLQEQEPHILDRVPQYHVASYLGIEPESLSRIRKKIIARQYA